MDDDARERGQGRLMDAARPVLDAARLETSRKCKAELGMKCEAERTSERAIFGMEVEQGLSQEPGESEGQVPEVGKVW